ncbi:MAG TPA: 1-deoxy-D-xylulose-5-phosphate reductoisomerase [Bacteroidales bacterium]|nr:1-deoxy-D-xylulose-5-phosphate reductoisomerase [Bacteroidales bacterium]
MTRKIALLGSTGSIGTQALDVISMYPDLFTAEVLVAGNNLDLLIRQARMFVPDAVVIANKSYYNKLHESLADLPVKVYCGDDAIDQVVQGDNVDMVLASMVGYSGLRPTLSAIKAGKDIALANKETLVAAGKLIRDAAEITGSRIVPVDSEHSAILQCLAGEKSDTVEKITLTASGGPFLNYTAEMLRNVRPSDALKHPNWEMGNKVTIDSASMMNKGLEVIEAKWLFNLRPDQIEVIIHPQSLIHSFVHFSDGSVKAQLGMPDMRVPILYALSYPDRLKSDLPRLDFNRCGNLTFFEPDQSRFRNLALAYEAMKRGGNIPCIMNAANEVAVHSFLDEEIRFTDIPEIIEYAMTTTEPPDKISVETIEKSDSEGRLAAREYINKIIKKS